jgi:hypothetical protein
MVVIFAVWSKYRAVLWDSRYALTPVSIEVSNEKKAMDNVDYIRHKTANGLPQKGIVSRSFRGWNPLPGINPNCKTAFAPKRSVLTVYQAK